MGMAVVVVMMIASAFVDEHWRLWIWGAVVALNVVGQLVQGLLSRRDAEGFGVEVTESMVERFGLFTIIVLGEVVVGVTNGIIDAGASAMSLTIGLLAMTIGFGFWWNYFDVLGRRPPRDSAFTMLLWIVLHLPLTGTIAAAGAGMVGLIEHGTEDHLGEGTIWLLVGSTAALLVLISLLVMTLRIPTAMSRSVRNFQISLWAGATVAVAIGFLHPSAWLLALALSLILGATWWFAFYVRAVAAELRQAE